METNNTKMHILNDYWYQCGTNIEDLKKAVKQKDASTIHYKIKSDDLCLISLLTKDDIELIKQDSGGNFLTSGIAYAIDADHYYAVKLQPGVPASVCKLQKKNLGALSGEIQESQMLVRLPFPVKDGTVYNRTVSVSPKTFINSLSCITGIGGSSIQNHSLHRDMHFRNGLKDIGNKAITILGEQSEDGLFKVFSVRSGKYESIPQSTLIDSIEMLSHSLHAPVMKEWYMDHFGTAVLVDFPTLATEVNKAYHLNNKLIPGMRIATSDTGHSCFKVSATWRMEGTIGIVYSGETFAVKHIGEIDPQSIVKRVDDTIFKNYTKLPKALQEQTTVCLNADQALMAMQSAMEDLGITKLIGKKRSNQELLSFRQTLKPIVQYSGYDVVCAIFGLADRCSIFMTDALQTNIGKSAYYDFRRFSRM